MRRQSRIEGAGRETGYYVRRIDAHKEDLFLAMLVGTEAAPVSWTVPNEPKAVKRLVRKLERRRAGARARVL